MIREMIRQGHFAERHTKGHVSVHCLATPRSDTAYAQHLAGDTNNL